MSSYLSLIEEIVRKSRTGTVDEDQDVRRSSISLILALDETSIVDLRMNFVRVDH